MNHEGLKTSFGFAGKAPIESVEADERNFLSRPNEDDDFPDAWLTMASAILRGAIFGEDSMKNVAEQMTS